MWRGAAGTGLMHMAAPQRVRWFNHVNAVNPPAELRHWMTDKASLTTKLLGRSKQFRVRPLKQRRALCLGDEHAAIALPRRSKVWERDVLLECDARPVVYAHTVVPAEDTANDWPFFRSLGTRSLGSALFSDPLIRRGQLQFARLSVNHPLMKRAAAVLGTNVVRQPLYARRCLYRRKRGHLLVTEVFLPSITALSPVGGNSKNNQ